MCLGALLSGFGRSWDRVLGSALLFYGLSTYVFVSPICHTMSTSPARLVEVFKPACVQSYRGHRHHTPIWATRHTYVRNCQLSVLGTCPLECLGQVRFLYMCVRTFLKFCSHTGPTDAIHVCTSRYRIINSVQKFFFVRKICQNSGASSLLQGMQTWYRSRTAV